MHIYLGSDHGGFAQKNLIIEALRPEGYEITDCGTYSSASTDYPDFALAVGKAVSEHADSMGILLCRSGEGMEMAVNKVPKIRGALVWREDVAAETRRDNDANVLVIPSDFVDDTLAVELARRFVATPFSNEDRHIKRLEKLHRIEHVNYEA